MMGQRVEPVAVETMDDAVGRAADQRRMLRDCVEHGLEIAGLARERAQDPDGSGELFADFRGTRGRRGLPGRAR
jgi:hypothetical protein